jgi:biopolymer transport protein ExbB/TolQ/LEA14-like dessication related protein
MKVKIKKSNPHILIGLICTLIVILSCVTIEVKAAEPSVDIEMGVRDDDVPVLTFDFVINNPNQREATLTDFEYYVYLNGNQTGHQAGIEETIAPLKHMESVTIKRNFSIPHGELLKHFLREGFNVTVNGSLSAKVSSWSYEVAFENATTIHIDKGAKMAKCPNITGIELETSESGINMSIVINNPNPVAIYFEGFDYDIYFKKGGKWESLSPEGVFGGHLIMPNESYKGSVEMEVSEDGFIQYLMRGSSTDIKVEGTMFSFPKEKGWSPTYFESSIGEVITMTDGSGATGEAVPTPTPSPTAAPTTEPTPVSTSTSYLEIAVDTTGNASFQLTEQYPVGLYEDFKSNYSEETAKNASSIFGLKEVKNVEDAFDDEKSIYKMSFKVPSFTTKMDDVWSSTEINLQRTVNSIKIILPDGYEIEKAEKATISKNVCEWTATEPSILTIPSIEYKVPEVSEPIIDIGAMSEKFKSFAQSGIYIISTNLLYPVLIILFILIGWSLIALGGFLYEWHARNRDFISLERAALKARTLLKANELDTAFDVLGKGCSNNFVHDFLSRLAGFKGVFSSKKLMEIKVEKLLQDFETEMTRRLEKSRLVTRAGPMLGLMGTLIPMGPALLALAGGDVKTLADNLIIAFGSTVLGLAAGLIGHTISMVRSRWYEQDMSDMEYLSEILFGESEVEGVEGLELGIKEGEGFEKEKVGLRLRQYLNKVKEGKWKRGKLKEILRKK